MNLADLTAWVEEERPDLDEQVGAQDRITTKRREPRRGAAMNAARWLRQNDPFYRAHYAFCLALGHKPLSWTAWDAARSRFEEPAHWKPRPVSVGYLEPLEIRSRDGFYDVDGTWCDAGELMQSEPLFGRAKALLEETGRLWNERGENVDFLQVGGWHIEQAGTTGQPLGRPPKGIRAPERIAQKMRRLLDHPDVFPVYVQAAFDFHDPNGERNKRQLADLRDIWSAVAKEDHVNVDALSRVSGVEKRQINKRAKRGLEKRAINATKGEEQMTNEAAVIAAYDEMRQDGLGYRGPYEENDVIGHIDARFDQLEQKVEDEVSDLFRVLYAFRYGETPAAEWDAYLAERQKGSTP